MKKALILHAWYSKPENNWYSWLKEKMLEKGYKISIPIIPTLNTNYPKLIDSLEFLEKNYTIDKETVIVGHSLSCVLALRLAEKHSLRRLILVAGWDYNDLYENHKYFWPNKINHDQIKKNNKEIYCITSDNDPYVTLFQANEMAKRLGAKSILIKKGGHFGSEEKTKQIIQLLPLL